MVSQYVQATKSLISALSRLVLTRHLLILPQIAIVKMPKISAPMSNRTNLNLMAPNGIAMFLVLCSATPQVVRRLAQILTSRINKDIVGLSKQVKTVH
jgi:hypothetical protein